MVKSETLLGMNMEELTSLFGGDWLKGNTKLLTGEKTVALKGDS